MFYSQVILAKKGPLAKVWLAAHWGDKKLGRPQIFATDISQSVESIVNPTVPLALRVSGHLLLGVVRIYSRKVKYVLNDCTEAMLKMQMAFLPRKDLLEQTDNKESKTVTTVANFGEYDQVHIVEGFCLPLPDENEWILAEDGGDEENETMMNQLSQQQQHQQRLSQQRQTRSSADYQPPEEEHWVPFDPENDDDDDDDDDNNDDQPNDSMVSEVELVRAANDESFLSTDQTRRESSLLLQQDDLPPPKSGATEESDDDPVDFGDVPFDGSDGGDDDNNIMAPPDTPGAADDSLLQLSLRESDAHNLSAISGLEEDDDGDHRSKRPSQVTPRRRKRKRRKVVIDNDKTELSTEHIKNMMSNTDDIVQRQVHPAEPQEDADSSSQKLPKIWLTQPFLADDGHLHPSLVKLFRSNFHRALDEECEYEQEEPVEDVEQPRKDVGNASDDEEQEELSTTLPSKKGGENDSDDVDNEPADYGNDFGGMEDEGEEDDDAAPPAEDLDDAPGLDSDNDQDDDVLPQGQDRTEMELEDLGLVNELAFDSEEEEDEDSREAIGDQSSNSTKWHKHTVRVLQLLQRKINVPGEDDDDGENKPSQEVQFEDLSHNCTRRTAASVFFELLQLKTWDFVELEQPEPYGDITVSAGLRFTEQPPDK